jgi:hypothetical protein
MAATATLTKATPSKANYDALPLEEQIRLRAYELYIKRGDTVASAQDDWLQAEQEILAHQTRDEE